MRYTCELERDGREATAHMVASPFRDSCLRPDELGSSGGHSRSEVVSMHTRFF